MNRATDFRPNSEDELKKAVADGLPVWTSCAKCGEPFSRGNIRTTLGWRDTQITGWCETCYDKVFVDEE